VPAETQATLRQILVRAAKPILGERPLMHGAFCKRIFLPSFRRFPKLLIRITRLDWNRERLLSGLAIEPVRLHRLETSLGQPIAITSDPTTTLDVLSGEIRTTLGRGSESIFLVVVSRGVRSVRSSRSPLLG
jgi:hypothetical protein